MNKRNHSPKSRPITALILVATTVFLLLGRNCGILGALIAGSADRLLGAAGLGLLCCTTWTLAFILATPPGTLTKMVVAVWRWTTRPQPASVVVVNRKATAAETAQDVVQAVRELTGPSPKDRRELDAIRDALKDLGYKKHEIEPLVAKMDPRVGFEKNVKSALKALQVN